MIQNSQDAARAWKGRVGRGWWGALLLVGALTSRTAPAQDLFEQLARAGRLIEAGQVRTAEIALADLVQRLPESQTAWFKLALARQAAGKLESAAAAIRRALELGSDQAHVRILAAELLVGCDPEAAKAHALAAVELAPDAARARRALRVLLQLGDVKAGKELLAELVAAAPKNPETHYLAAELALRAGDTKAAISAYRTITELRPCDPFAWESLAGVLIAADRDEAAAKALERALEIHPSNIPAREKLIDILARSEAPAPRIHEQQEYLRYYRWAAQPAEPR